MIVDSKPLDRLFVNDMNNLDGTAKIFAIYWALVVKTHSAKSIAWNFFEVLFVLFNDIFFKLLLKLVM